MRAATLPRAATVRAMATAAAYLRLDLRTGRADAVSGAQVDFVLVDIHRDDTITPGRGGRFQVATADGRVIRYAPIARGRVQYAGWYEHATHPNGLAVHKHAPMTGQKVHRAVVRADGVHILADGTVVRIARGRCAETWTPLPDTPSENR